MITFPPTLNTFKNRNPETPDSAVPPPPLNGKKKKKWKKEITILDLDLH
jgi:hypothetical protein